MAHRVFQDEMEWTGTMGYQAATDAMVPKEKREWQDLRGKLVWRDKRERVEKMLIIETGGSACGEVKTFAISA